jgi:two-component system sensor histidine kinase QseC
MRRQLLVVLLSTLAIVWVATAAFSYFDARHELDELLDAHLAQSTTLLIAQAGHDLDEIDEHADDVHRYARRVAFQFWRRGTSLELHSKNAPDVRLSPREEGFSDARIDGRRWRVFSAWDRDRRYLVQVGEQAATRDAIVGAMLRGMLLPLAAALPVLAILLWLAIERALRPLRTLGRQVAHRAPDNLGAIDVGSAPAEVAPLVADLNRLFERVRSSMDNERRFTADAAHELRTPLAAIRAQAQVARGARADTERTHALEGVIAGCDRATHLVDQLLTLARLEPDEFRANRKPVELHTIAQAAIGDIAPIALDRSVDVVLAEGPAVSLQADARLLGILLRNLLDNAVRYSPQHAVVQVAVATRDRKPVVTVQDAGPGVPPKARAELGQRFRRFAGADTAGTGLGLSIVKRIAELHGADVAFDEAAGGGLAVTVAFPA